MSLWLEYLYKHLSNVWLWNLLNIWQLVTIIDPRPTHLTEGYGYFKRYLLVVHTTLEIANLRHSVTQSLTHLGQFGKMKIFSKHLNQIFSKHLNQIFLVENIFKTLKKHKKMQKCPIFRKNILFSKKNAKCPIFREKNILFTKKT